ncbi:lysylphosphatidylglycerol synthase transmembrane domain-containing protein [Bdellovibrionota bacterium FG-2]
MAKSSWIQRAMIGLILAAACFFLFRYRREFLNIRIHEPWLLIPLSFLVVGFFFTNGLHNRFFLRAFSLRLTPTEWFGLSVVNTLGNLLTPMRGGAISNAVYLKQKYGFSYASYVGVLSATYVIMFWINSLMGLLALVAVGGVLGGAAHPLGKLIALVFGGSFLFFTLIILFSPRFPAPQNRFLAKCVHALNDWHQVRSNRPVIVATASIGFVNVLLMTLMAYVQLRLVGSAVSLEKCMVISVFSSFSLFLSITPGSLGIREAFAAVSGFVVGLSPAVMVAASVIERLINFGWSLGLGLVFSRALMLRASKTKRSI